MERTLFAVFAAAVLAACTSTRSEAPTVSWPECAKAQALAWFESDAPATWSAAQAVPADVPVQTAPLGAFPPDAIHDALHRTLHLVPSSNSMYVQQTGGVAGITQLYGPISLAGYCPAPQLGAP